MFAKFKFLCSVKGDCDCSSNVCTGQATVCVECLMVLNICTGYDTL